jgi:glucan endo-1,3-alpha-glucosidase
MNVGQPDMPFAKTTIDELFASAQGTDFQLFFSIDTYQHGNIADFQGLIAPYLTNANYYKGPNGGSFLSTFGAGSTSPQDWTAFKSALGGPIYFVPDLDNAAGYYTDTASFLSAWHGVVDGLFSWETAWPAQADTPSNVSTASDAAIMAALAPTSKSYMISLSSLQYKHLPNEQATHYYRPGEANLPQRMTEILALAPSPDFVEVVTWNDAGEGHYVSDNLWAEGLPQDILDYANADDWGHAGWQPLLASFIQAFAGEQSAAGIVPAGDAQVAGSMWYRALLKDAACARDPLGKPGGWQAAADAVNWAVVLKAGAEGYKVRVSSGGAELQTVDLGAGLNYGSTPGMGIGAQLVEVLDGSGTVVAKGAGKMEVQADSDGICNFNYQVAALA